jgi:hypothetical protein
MKPLLRPPASGVTACSPGSASSSSTITIARLAFVMTARERPCELVSHVSSCPASIRSRSTASAAAGDAGTVPSLKIQDSAMRMTFSYAASGLA